MMSFPSQDNIQLYSLPGLVPGQKFNVTSPYAPRSTSHGLVYVPNNSMIAELKISQEGVSAVRRLFLFSFPVGFNPYYWGIISVAVAPETGQLYILWWSYSAVHLALHTVGIDDVLTVDYISTVPDQFNMFSGISALHTDRVLVTMLHPDLVQCSSVLYQGHNLSYLTNLTQKSCTSIAYRDHFLVVDHFGGDILVLDDQGRMVHMVDYGDGFVKSVRDLAVWQDSVFVVDGYGALVLLSPV